MTDSLPPELEEVLLDLGHCIRALGRYTESAVLTGGLAALLYRWCLPAANTHQPPLMTFDMDWALPARLERFPGPGLHEQMQLGGFRPWLQGSGKEPVTYYQHERHDPSRRARIYAEFIAPREGSKTDRRGTNRGIIEIEPNLHVQTDPYIGLLLAETVDLDVSRVPWLGLPTPQVIHLPHPICFVVQKILIRPGRPQHKKASDAAHIYDVALLTRSMWPQMAETLGRVEKAGPFPKSWFSRARRTLATVFSNPGSPGPIEIAGVYHGIMGERSAPTEAAISRVLAQFWEAVGLA